MDRLAAIRSRVSANSFLEILWVVGGARSTVRITCRGGDLPDLAADLETLGLASVAWRDTIYPSAVAGLGGYAYTAAVSPAEGRADGRRLVFVSRSLRRAEEARAAQGDRDRLALGRSLGYPLCCNEHFNRREAEFVTGFAPCFEATAGPHPYLSNPLLDPFGRMAVSHFPCRPDCAATLRLAADHQAALARLDPSLAAANARHLCSYVLWRPDLGVLYGTPLQTASGAISIATANASAGWRALGELGQMTYVVASGAATLPDGRRLEGVHGIDHTGGARPDTCVPAGPVLQLAWPT